MQYSSNRTGLPLEAPVWTDGEVQKEVFRNLNRVLVLENETHGRAFAGGCGRSGKVGHRADVDWGAETLGWLVSLSLGKNLDKVPPCLLVLSFYLRVIFSFPFPPFPSILSSFFLFFFSSPSHHSLISTPYLRHSLSSFFRWRRIPHPHLDPFHSLQDFLRKGIYLVTSLL